MPAVGTRARLPKRPIACRNHVSAGQAVGLSGGTIMVANYAAGRDVLLDPNMFDSTAAANLEPTLLGADGEQHRDVRRLLVRDLSPAKIEDLAGKAAVQARHLLDRPRLDLLTEFARPLSLAAISEVVGLPSDDIGLISSLCRLSFKDGSGEPWSDLAPEVQQRAALAGTLLAAGSPHIGPVQARGLVALMCVAGVETLQTAILTSSLAFLLDADLRRKVAGDERTLRKATEELLRLYPPVQRLVRNARADTQICGLPVAAGDLVTLLLVGMNRDPAIFDRPDEFVLEREDSPHLSFGHGGHQCLGAGLARKLLHSVMRVFAEVVGPHWRLEDPDLAQRFADGTFATDVPYQVCTA